VGLSIETVARKHPGGGGGGVGGGDSVSSITILLGAEKNHGEGALGGGGGGVGGGGGGGGGGWGERGGGLSGPKRRLRAQQICERGQSPRRRTVSTKPLREKKSADKEGVESFQQKGRPCCCRSEKLPQKKEGAEVR